MSAKPFPGVNQGAPRPTANRIVIRTDFSTHSRGFFSFMGPIAYHSLRKAKFDCHYYCDGMLASTLFSIVLRRSIRRISFDYTSIAQPFFEECQQQAKRVLVVGGTAADAASFGQHLKLNYPRLPFRCLDGYPSGGYTARQLELLKTVACEFDVVLLALGSPLQEKVGQYLFDRLFPGTIITAGAFITQTVVAGARPYYPRLINTLHLRFIWRLLREPHTRSRFRLVFKFPFSYLIDRIRGNIEIICHEDAAS